MILKQSPELSCCSFRIPPPLYDNIKYGAFIIYGSPEINHRAVNLGVDFIQMPNRGGAFGSGFKAALLYVRASMWA